MEGPLQSVTLNAQLSFAYTGSDLFYVDDDTIAYITGNGINFHSLKHGTHSILFGQGFGISCFTVCRKLNVIAYAERRIKPTIYIHSTHRERLLLSTLKEGTELEFAALAFSRDGSNFVSMGRLPDFKLTVWNWEASTILIQTKLPGSCVQLSINPRNANEVCCSGNGHLLFWRLDKSYETYSLEHKAFYGLPDHRIVTHAWTSKGYVCGGCQGGQLVACENFAGPLVEMSKDSAAISSVVVSKNHIVVGMQDGRVAWYSQWELRELESITNLAANDRAVSVDPFLRLDLRGPSPAQAVVIKLPELSDVCAACFSPNFNTLLIGSSTGQLLALQLRGEPQAPIARELTNFFDVQEVCISHRAAVTGMCVLPGARILATCSADSHLRLLDFHTGNILLRKPLPAPLTALAHHPTFALLAVGSRSGVLRLLDAFRPERYRLIHRVRLHTTPITQILFSPGGEFLCTASTDGMVYFLSAALQDDFRVIGYVPVPGAVVSLSWVTFAQQPRLLVVSVVDSFLFSLPPPDHQVVENRWSLYPEVCKRAKVALKSPPTGAALTVSKRGTDAEHLVLFATGGDKKLRQYSFPDQRSAVSHFEEDNQGDCPEIVPTAAEFDGPQKSGGIAVACVGDFYVVTGGLDGLVTLRPTFRPSRMLVSRRFHDPATSGVSAVAVSPDYSYIFTGGHDGSVLALSIRPIPAAPDQQASIPLGATVEVEDIEGPDELTFVEAQLKNQRDIEYAMQMHAKNKFRVLLNRLKTKLDNSLANNEKVHELERLERIEFVIDLSEKERAVAEGERLAAQARDVINYDNVAKDMVWNRIKSECWDSMDVQGLTLRSFLSGSEVTNHPLRKHVQQELDALEAVQNIRRVESVDDDLAQERKHAEEFAKQACQLLGIGRPNGTLTTPTPTPATTAVPKSKPASKREAEDDDEARDQQAATQEADRSGIQNDLLLHCNNQKLNQSFLLADTIHTLKRQFNAKLTELLERKRAEIERINEKNVRIKEILAELQAKEEVFEPALTDLELPERVLVVSDSEVQVDKVLSAAERDEMERKWKFDEERRKNQEGDDAAARALKDMMGGTLEASKETTQLQELVRPDWMTEIPYEDMTEEQQKQVKEFEALEKVFREEKEKQRKTLEAELKKIRSDITEQCRGFDDKVQEVFDFRMLTDQTIYELELRIVKLSIALLQDEEDEARERLLVAQAEELHTKRMRTISALNQFKREVETFRTEYENVSSEDKVAEKMFKKDFADADEHLDALYRLFKRRQTRPSMRRPQMPWGDDNKSGRASGPGAFLLTPQQDQSMSAKQGMTTSERRTKVAGSTSTKSASARAAAANREKERAAQAAMMEQIREAVEPTVPNPEITQPDDPDPFGAVDRETAANVERQPEPLDLALDRPPGLDDALWHRLVAARDAKIALEAEVKRRSAQLQDMQRRLKQLEDADDATREEMDQTVRELQEVREERQREAVNVEVLCKVKQGQVEVEQAAVVTDYGDAILINRSVVGDLNNVIRQLGKEKVQILREIKDFRKGIHMIQWENQRLDMEAEDLVTKIRELQLMRVTKNLQEIIKGGGDAAKHAQEVAQLENRLRHSLKLHDDKVNERKAGLGKLEKMQLEKAAENEALDGRVAVMHDAVLHRAHIHSLASSNEGEKIARRRIKSMVTRRKLLDIAKAQTDEIELLRDELDRLRQRTFPSFPTYYDPMDQQLVPPN